MRVFTGPAIGWVGFFLALLAVPNASGIELITNGGFETGDFTGWTVTDLAGGDGSWFIDDNDGDTPDSSQATVGPASGDFYAVSDQGGPGTHVLEQSFTVPATAASVSLSFDMFVNDSDGGPIIDPAGLDHTVGMNQHSRVDLMTASADAFDTGAGVLATYYVGVDPQANNPNPYMNYLFNMTGVAVAGGTYKIRFAEVDNRSFLNQGVDNVSIDYVPVPEPTTLALTVVAVMACCRVRRR